MTYGAIALGFSAVGFVPKCINNRRFKLKLCYSLVEASSRRWSEQRLPSKQIDDRMR